MSDLDANLKAIQAAVRQLHNDPLAVARARALMPLSAHAASIVAANREDLCQKEFVELLEETYSTDVISVVKASQTFLKIAYDPNQSNKMERLAINQINEKSETAIATKGRLVEQQNKLVGIDITI